jgi:histone deacetylase 6
VAVSAGFDAADGDILGECCVTPAGYAHMTYMLSTLAGGKLVVVLEVRFLIEAPLLSSYMQGGYTLESLSNCALAVGRMLLGEAPPELPPLVASELKPRPCGLLRRSRASIGRISTLKLASRKKVSQFVHHLTHLKLILLPQILRSSHSLFQVCPL